MYILAVKKDFIARHFLIGGDWGMENQEHSHHYQLEVQIEGKDLDKHGYLVDIVTVKSYLEKLISHYRDRLLNDLPEFAGLNPSIENLARFSYQALKNSIQETGGKMLKITVWEDDEAWIAYQEE